MERLSRVYGMTTTELLADTLDPAGLDLLELPADLDHDVPIAVLVALSARTGVEVGQLRAMTLAGWVPWLFDTLDLAEHDTQAVFSTYVGDHSVLLAPGEAGAGQVTRRVPGRGRQWAGPWHPPQWLRRDCPVCVIDPDRGRDLAWQLPLVLSCAEHRCHLIGPRDLDRSLAQSRLTRRDLALGNPLPAPVPVEEPLATLDSYTYQALDTGRVELPLRIVHAAVWFRMLRALLDEVSIIARRAESRRILDQVWQAAGGPARGGLRTWRPYEFLDPDTQHTLLHTAATALDLIAQDDVRPRGRLGALLAPAPVIPVDIGDHPGRVLSLGERRARHDAGLRLPPPPPPRVSIHQASLQVRRADRAARSSAVLHHDLAVLLDDARAEPPAARRLMEWLTRSTHPLDHPDALRRCLIALGIPEPYLR